MFSLNQKYALITQKAYSYKAGDMILLSWRHAFVRLGECFRATRAYTSFSKLSYFVQQIKLNCAVN